MLLCTQGLYPVKPGSTMGCLDLPFGFARSWATATCKFKRSLAAIQGHPVLSPLSAEAGGADEKNNSLTSLIKGGELRVN